MELSCLIHWHSNKVCFLFILFFSILVLFVPVHESEIRTYQFTCVFFGYLNLESKVTTLYLNKYSQINWFVKNACEFEYPTCTCNKPRNLYESRNFSYSGNLAFVICHFWNERYAKITKSVWVSGNIYSWGVGPRGMLYAFGF